MNCYKLIKQIKEQKATLLWEYNFNLSKEDFKNIESEIYDPHKSEECKELVISLYLFFISLELYKKGDFWSETILSGNQNEKNKFYSYFREFLKRYGLFSLNSKKRQPKEFLVHAVLPKYYVNNFLDIAKKVYENEDDLEYLLFIDNSELERYFKYSIKSIKELIKHNETSIIIKDLLYRTTKTFDNIYNYDDKNRYNLPEWFFESIKSYLNSNKKISRKNNYITFLDTGYVEIDFILEEDIYFFDEDKKLITIKEDNNTISFTKEPRYIVINRDVDDLIDEIEDYFSSVSSRWNVLDANFYCYELENELIGEELGEFECKKFKINYSEIEIEPLNNDRQFPIYLKSDLITYFDGIRIKNFSNFSKIFLNNEEINEPILSLDSGVYELKAISSLGNIVQSKKIRVIPFHRIEKQNDKIYVDNISFTTEDIITIDNIEFEYEHLEIFLQHKQTKQEENIILFRQKNNYHISVKYIPSYIKHLKIVYIDANNHILDKKRINKNDNKVEISEEIKESSSFPLKIYLEYKDIDGYKRLLIGTMYFIEIQENEDSITIYPNLDIFDIVIQSRYDIFSKPLRTREKIIEYKKFPNPKSGDFNIIVYDNRTNNKITRQLKTYNHLKSDDVLVNYFADSENFTSPIIKRKQLQRILKNLKYINYHFLSDIVVDKLNILLKDLYHNFDKEIDDFIQKEEENIIKLKYMILFDKKISIDFDKKIIDIDEDTLLAIKIRFLNEIKSVMSEELLELFFEILQENQEKHRVKIFEILEYPLIQHIINESIIKG